MGRSGPQLLEEKNAQQRAGREAKIKSYLTKSIHHMQMGAIGRCFNSWAATYRKCKRERNLLNKALGTMRNKKVAATMGPWLAMWRQEKDRRSEEYMEALARWRDSEP